jgi:hypothetical protein
LHRPPLSGPFDEAALANWVDGIQHVQDRLGRTILLGKCLPSSPSSPDAAELAGPTPDFLAEVCRHSGCGLMLDLGHLLVAELNRVRHEARQAGAPAIDPAIALRQARARALDFIWSLPPPFVTQFLLAGFRWPTDPGQMLSDARSQRIASAPPSSIGMWTCRLWRCCWTRPAWQPRRSRSPEGVPDAPRTTQPDAPFAPFARDGITCRGADS